MVLYNCWASMRSAKGSASRWSINAVIRRCWDYVALLARITAVYIYSVAKEFPSFPDWTSCTRGDHGTALRVTDGLRGQYIPSPPCALQSAWVATSTRQVWTSVRSPLHWLLPRRSDEVSPPPLIACNGCNGQCNTITGQHYSRPDIKCRA